MGPPVALIQSLPCKGSPGVAPVRSCQGCPCALPPGVGVGWARWHDPVLRCGFARGHTVSVERGWTGTAHAFAALYCISGGAVCFVLGVPGAVMVQEPGALVRPAVLLGAQETAASSHAPFAVHVGGISWWRARAMLGGCTARIGAPAGRRGSGARVRLLDPCRAQLGLVPQGISWFLQSCCPAFQPAYHNLVLRPLAAVCGSGLHGVSPRCAPAAQ